MYRYSYVIAQAAYRSSRSYPNAVVSRQVRKHDKGRQRCRSIGRPGNAGYIFLYATALLATSGDMTTEPIVLLSGPVLNKPWCLTAATKDIDVELDLLYGYIGQLARTRNVHESRILRLPTELLEQIVDIVPRSTLPAVSLVCSHLRIAQSRMIPSLDFGTRYQLMRGLWISRYAPHLFAITTSSLVAHYLYDSHRMPIIMSVEDMEWAWENLVTYQPHAEEAILAGELPEFKLDTFVSPFRLQDPPIDLSRILAAVPRLRVLEITSIQYTEWPCSSVLLDCQGLPHSYLDRISHFAMHDSEFKNPAILHSILALFPRVKTLDLKNCSCDDRIHQLPDNMKNLLRPHTLDLSQSGNSMRYRKRDHLVPDIAGVLAPHTLRVLDCPLALVSRSREIFSAETERQSTTLRVVRLSWDCDEFGDCLADSLPDYYCAADDLSTNIPHLTFLSLSVARLTCFNIPESSSCDWDGTYHTREHVLLDCERYAGDREILQKVSPELRLADILGTEKGIEALVEFLAVSGAFTKTGALRVEWEWPKLEDEESEDEEEGEDEEDDE